MEKIGTNIFVETVYPGVNVGCIITEGEAICVDTPLLPGEAQRWMARIRSLGGEFVCFVVYTNGQRERILGAQYILGVQKVEDIEDVVPVRRLPGPRRVPIAQLVIPVTPEFSVVTRKGAVVAHRLAWEQVAEHCTDSFKQSMIDMFGERDPDMMDLEVILPQITFDERLKLFAGDVEVTLLAAGSGVLWVWLPEQRVLFAGDTVVVSTHPALNIIDIQEWLEALEWLRHEPQFQDAVIVPGRGALCDTSAADPLTEYLCKARDKTRQIYREGRPKADLNAVAEDLLELYPVADGQSERVQRQIKLGLDDLFDAFKTTGAASA